MTNETIDAAELAARYSTLLSERDALAAENARLREALLDGADAITDALKRGAVIPGWLSVLQWKLINAAGGMEALLAREAARALLEAPR